MSVSALFFFRRSTACKKYIILSSYRMMSCVQAVVESLLFGVLKRGRHSKGERIDSEAGLHFSAVSSGLARKTTSSSLELFPFRSDNVAHRGRWRHASGAIRKHKRGQSPGEKQAIRFEPSVNCRENVDFVEVPACVGEEPTTFGHSEDL